jgi:hypothetical protein
MGYSSLDSFYYPIRGRGEPKQVNNKDGGPPPS